jgi:hypothetical protein
MQPVCHSIGLFFVHACVGNACPAIELVCSSFVKGFGSVRKPNIPTFNL